MSETLTLLEDLIRRESITPVDAGCQAVLVQRLSKLGFKEERLDFGDTKNIWLKRGESKPLFVFLGHTDVVPTGDLNAWDSRRLNRQLKKACFTVVGLRI
jgi:succinyl-diaminopimelate desuccinylase